MVRLLIRSGKKLLLLLFVFSAFFTLWTLLIQIQTPVSHDTHSKSQLFQPEQSPRAPEYPPFPRAPEVVKLPVAVEIPKVAGVPKLTETPQAAQKDSPNQPPLIKPDEASNHGAPQVKPPARPSDSKKGETVLHPQSPPPRSEENSTGPGEGGKPFKVDVAALTPDEKREYDQGWENHAFSQYVSDLISVRRRLPDARDGDCLTQTFHSDLPRTAVIICFHNEAWSVLLRSVHSVIDNSPPELLAEIVLVDDFSDFDYLKQPLEDYMKQLGIVKIVRTVQRTGLIRGRMLGAHASTAEVLTFLDSHIECTKGWLEPLLHEIKSDWTAVVTPVIEIIRTEDFSFAITPSKDVQVGGFGWGLTFTWHLPPENESKRPGAPYSPIKSPTMAGGLFSIHRDFFTRLGEYDPGMEVWGGENLELSFKTWMCGGSLKTVVCSHVGHLFRARSPYKWVSNFTNPLRRNSVRLAEVWMDDYKAYYYETIQNDLGDYGDLSDRKALREKLKCHDFQWYLDTIYPELFLPSKALASGDIESYVESACLDCPTNAKDQSNVVKSIGCHRQRGNQLWLLSAAGEIRRDDRCLDAGVRPPNLGLFDCHGQGGNQLFTYAEDGTIRHSENCVEYNGMNKPVLLKPCDGSIKQRWKFDRKPYKPSVNNKT